MQDDELEYISLIEQAAEKRFPYSENNSTGSFFNALQNSSRGDFMDGAKWYEEHTRELFTRLANLVIKFRNDYEADPESESDKALYFEIEQACKDAVEIKVYPKDKINPTYPFTNLTKTIAELQERNKQLEKDWCEMIDREVKLENEIKQLHMKTKKSDRKK